MGAKPAERGGGFAHGKPIPPERRCQAVVKTGKRAGETCGAWTAPDSDGQYTSFCSGHLGIPQRRWQEMSEERKLEKRLALDAARAQEAAARDKQLAREEEAETKATIEREALRRRQREREEEQRLRLEEEQARRHPPVTGRQPGPGETWTKARREPGKGKLVDEHGSFDWVIVPTLQVLRQTVDQMLIDDMRARDRIMSPRVGSRLELIQHLNAKRRRRERETLLRWP